MRRFLMCPPDRYGVEYEINPWMHRLEPPDHRLAVSQWAGLHELMSVMPETTVELIDPATGLPDMVFTANAGLVIGDIVVLSRFRHPERRGEEEHFRRWFAEHGLKVVELPEGLHFEGAGDCLRAGGTWYGGYFFRSEPTAHAAVSEIIGEEIIPLRLIDERFYHLDTCFLPLGDSLVYYPGAFDEYSLAVLRDRFPEGFEVDEEEAARFACNSVVIDNWVVMNSGSPRTCAALAQRGYECVDVNLSEFLKAGGAAKCLTLALNL